MLGFDNKTTIFITRYISSIWTPRSLYNKIEPSHKILQGRRYHDFSNFLERGIDWILEIIQTMIILNIHVTFNETPDKIVHGGEVRWARWPCNVGIMSPSPADPAVRKFLINPFVPTVPTFAVRETASLGQQMLNAPVGINGLTDSMLNILTSF